MDAIRFAQRSPVRPLLQAALLSSALAAVPAFASPVTVTGTFGQYTGAVGNGEAYGLSYLTFVNGSPVAPDEPIPGLESLFTPGDPSLDPSDPLYVGQGIGRTTVDLSGSSSIQFSTAYFDPAVGYWVYDTDNLLEFTPGPEADVGVGEEFLLGTFTLANGIFWAADPIHRFTFTLTTASSDPLLDGKSFSDTIELQITGNCFTQPICGDFGYTPENNADLFYFSARRDLGTMAVYELQDSPTGSNFGSIDLYGKVGSLILTQLTNPQGGVVLGPPEGFPPPQPPNPVPTPSTLVLLMGAALGMAWTRRRGNAA